MNFTQTFEDFGSNFNVTNIFVYLGAAVIAWVLFKDKININPVKDYVEYVFNILKSKTSIAKSVNSLHKPNPTADSLFLELVVSWKRTRDLARKLKCDKAVTVADEMFPYLSPGICDGDVQNPKPNKPQPNKPQGNNN